MRLCSSILFLVMLTFASCTDQYARNKNYYERVSGVKVPADYRLLEFYDNGEFETAAAFTVDSVDLQKFITTYNLKPMLDPYSTAAIGIGFQTNKPSFDNLRHMYMLRGQNGKTFWTYVADLEKERLWAQINYPDWGGQ
jgi:hypothetical protein